MMDRIAVCAAFLAAAGGMSSSAAEMLRNGSFEDVANGRTVGWDVGRHWQFAKACGMNGTRGLAFENLDEKDFHEYPSQPVAFEAGKRYQYSIMAKTEGLTRSVGLCVEWFDRDGKWLSGSYQNALEGTHDWTRIEGVTPPIPSEAASVRLAFYVRKGGLGKAWFDDVSMRPLSRAVFGGLYTSAYRNLQKDGAVRFHAAVNRSGHPGAKAYFTYTDAAGRERRVAASRTTETAAVLELDASHLAYGTHAVSCELLESGGKRLGGGSIEFTRPHEMPNRRTWIDGHRRAIVDGKPFFPLGIYVIAPDDNLMTGPFNCIMPYRKMNRESLDRCRAQGIEVIYPLNSDWAWSKQRPKGVETDEDAQAAVEKEVLELKDHPAILAWYTNDEIPIEKFPKLLARQKLLERIDPGHPTWSVLYQFGEVRSYYPTFDVIGTDPYPVPQASIGNVALWTRTTREEVMDLKPMWQVPQAFSWGEWSRKEGDTRRFPTREEMVNMTWQCVANGANGLVYWCYRLLYQDGKFRVDHWADICAAVASVKPYVPMILSDETAPEVKCANENLSVRAWRYQGDAYLAVVNNTRETVSGKVDVKASFAKVRVLQGNAGCVRRAAEGALMISLEGLGYAVLALDR